jgi:ubiquinone/menaquinone biosynthesis C-methylase UbiE
LNSVKQFYDDLHDKNDKYAGGEYNLSQLLSVKGLKSWLSKYQGSNLNIADVGCGKGVFLRDFTAVLTEQYQMTFHKMGIDLVKSSNHVLDEQHVEFIQTDLDGTQLPLEDNSVDIITCNHVLEHIFYTENLIQEFKRILKPTGICIISVPNLSAWVNRFFLLFSIQPLSCEVGANSIDYGLWLPYFKKHVNNLGVGAAGHIRSFTPRSLQDIVENSGGGVKSLLKQ